MKILFLTDNFPPEVNAPASRTYEHCKIWVEAGHEVTVITCFPNYPLGKRFGDHNQGMFIRENIDGIKVIRGWTYMTSNAGVFRRIIDYMSFAATSIVIGLFLKTDVIIATSPQFFTAIGGRLLSLFKTRPWIMEVRDLWPESIIAVGALKNNGLIRFLTKLEYSLYRSASKIIVVTESFEKHLTSRGIAREKISVIKNGVDPYFIKNGVTEVGTTRLQEIRKKSKYLVGYIGTIGMAHGLTFLLEAARSAPAVDFILVGDGADKKKLQEQANTDALPNLHFFPAIPRIEVRAFLAALDVAVVPLRKSDLFKTVIPSKIFEIAAMEVPILLGVDGEARLLVEGYQAGLFFTPESSFDFLAKMYRIKNETELSDQLKKGCRQLAADFDRKKLAGEMLKVILEAERR